MTEKKRFTYIEEDLGGMVLPKCLDDGETVAKSVYECVGLLNALNDENEQLKHKLSQQEMEYATTCYHLSEDYEKLKQEVRELEKTYAEEVFKIEDKFDEEILALEKENEQLKSELKALKKK